MFQVVIETEDGSRYSSEREYDCREDAEAEASDGREGWFGDSRVIDVYVEEI